MSPDRVLRVGVIGGSVTRGWASLVHLPILDALPGFRIEAVCTTNEESARLTAERYNAPLAFTDPRELVSHPDIDIAAVSVRVPLHYEFVKLALQAGKHVYSEWPLVPTLDEARELLALAEANGVHHAVGLQGRCAPAIQKVKSLIAEGYLGDVIACTVRFGIHTNGGHVDSARKDHVYKESGAGLLQVHGGHILDDVRFVLGGFESVSANLAIRHSEVLCDGETVIRTAPDQILINATFESGVVGSVHIQGGKLHGGGFEFTIQGTKGDLELATVGSHAVQVDELEIRGSNDERPYEHMEKSGHVHKPREPLGVIEADDDPRVPEQLRKQPTYNTSRLYLQFGDDIRKGTHTVPDFATAVRFLELMASFEAASESGCRQATPTDKTYS